MTTQATRPRLATPLTIIASLTVGIGATLVAAPAASASNGTGPGTDVYVGCTEHTAKPEHISLACADDSVSFDGLTWSSWSSGRATGVGTFSYNTCLPTCVDGNTVTAKQVKVLLSRPKVAKGVRYFSLLTAVYPNASGPAGMASSTFTLNGPPKGA